MNTCRKCASLAGRENRREKSVFQLEYFSACLFHSAVIAAVRCVNDWRTEESGAEKRTLKIPDVHEQEPTNHVTSPVYIFIFRQCEMISVWAFYYRHVFSATVDALRHAVKYPSSFPHRIVYAMYSPCIYHAICHMAWYGVLYAMYIPYSLRCDPKK